MGNKNFIVINGKKYDTVTGKLLQDSPTLNKPVINTLNFSSNTGVVDGFMRKPTVKKPRPLTAQHNVKQVQKSQTLMRQVVKKPNVQVSQSQSTKPSIQKSHLGVSARRSETAKQTPKSQQVQKFGTLHHRTSVVSTSEHLPVAVAPAHHNPTVKNSVTPPTKAAHRPSASEKMIEAALANASSHTEVHPHKKKKRSKILKKLGISAKAAGMSSAILAGVLLGGFFAIQNVPNLSMRVAAARAGFDAQMPGYQPSGFSFKGPINYTTGKVTVSFESNSDEREYEVSQQASNWNSDALLSNYVVVDNKQYQTYLDRGRTLYIYDGSNATWVDNGVWYTVEGNSDMTTDQLIRIAASI